MEEYAIVNGRFIRACFCSNVVFVFVCAENELAHGRRQEPMLSLWRKLVSILSLFNSVL